MSLARRYVKRMCTKHGEAEPHGTAQRAYKVSFVSQKPKTDLQATNTTITTPNTPHKTERGVNAVCFNTPHSLLACPYMYDESVIYKLVEIEGLVCLLATYCHSCTYTRGNLPAKFKIDGAFSVEIRIGMLEKWQIRRADMFRLWATSGCFNLNLF